MLELKSCKFQNVLVLLGCMSVFASPLSAEPLPNAADEDDILLIRECAFEKHYETALKCTPNLMNFCFSQDLLGAYQASSRYCYRRAYLAWDAYRETQLVDARDYMGKTGPARAALETSVTAFAAWRSAECASELASWPDGSDEGADVRDECLLRLTARRAVFLGVKGVP